MQMDHFHCARTCILLLLTVIRIPTQIPPSLSRLQQSRPNEKSYTFQVDTEDGGHYLFQALNKSDLNLWIKAISTAVQSYAQRRLTYIGDSSQLQFTDPMQSGSAAPVQDPGAGTNFFSLLTIRLLTGDSKCSESI